MSVNNGDGGVRDMPGDWMEDGKKKKRQWVS